MTYFEKYLKYKKKYLLLKNAPLQLGGDAPNIYVLKNISLFTPDSDLDLHLNPVYGFLYTNIGYIDDIFNFGIDNSEYKIIRKCFHKLDNKVVPVKDLRITVPIDDFCKLISYLYLQHLFKDSIDKIRKIIDKLNNFLLKGTDINRQKYIENKLSDFKIDGIELNSSDVSSSNINGLLEYYKKELNKIIIPPKFKSSLIKNYFPQTHIKDYNLNIFYIILVILWSKFGDKSGILEYYESLNKYLLNQFKITIPEDFTNTLFTLDEIVNPKKDFYSILVNIYYKNIQSIQILGYEKVDYVANICNSCTRPNARDRCYFPDCGETTLRNFFNIIFYNEITNTFNLRRLCELEASENLKEYYTKFNSMASQANKTSKNIFGKELNARDAWAYIVSNLEDVNYLQKCELKADNIEYKFEINTGKSSKNILNILEVIGNLLKVNRFEDFTEIEIIENSVDINGFGKIKFKNKSTNAYYEFKLNKGHYDLIEIKEGTIATDYTHLNISQQKYLDLLLGKNIKEILEKDINDIYLINYRNKEILISVLNNYCEKLEDIRYNKVLKYINEVFSPDEKRRTNLFLSKISNLRNYNLKQYGIDIIFENDNVITKLDYSVSSSQKIIDFPQNITHITTGANYNGPFNNLPSCLTNLTIAKGFNENVDILPKKLIYLDLGEDFNQPLDNLPKSLTQLNFGFEFNQPVDNLPKSLTQLNFGYNFNQPVDNLPKSLTHLTFGEAFNHLVDKLPTDLTHLTFEEAFNQPVDKLPKDLTQLTFGYYFNQPVDELPKDLIELTFGYSFNQPVDKLPKRLSILKFGESFNQPVDELPKDLTQLTFGYNFNQSVDKLPKDLIQLTFGYNFNQPIYSLPSTITHLYFNMAFNHPVDILPCRLKQLTFSQLSEFNQPVNTLPSTIKQLTFGRTFNQQVDNLPKDLTELTFGAAFNKLVDNLPKNLTHLKFGRFFNKQVNSLPSTLKHLTFRDAFNQPVDYLPKDLTELTFGDAFNQLVDNLPKSLTILRFGKNFNKPVDKLPNTLTALTLGYEFNQNIDNLPKCITIMSFGGLFNQNINNLPPYLTQLEISRIAHNTMQSLRTLLPSTIKYLVFPRIFLRNIIIPDGCKVTGV